MRTNKYKTSKEGSLSLVNGLYDKYVCTKITKLAKNPSIGQTIEEKWKPKSFQPFGTLRDHPNRTVMTSLQYRIAEHLIFWHTLNYWDPPKTNPASDTMYSYIGYGEGKCYIHLYIFWIPGNPHFLIPMATVCKYFGGIWICDRNMFVSFSYLFYTFTFYLWCMNILPSYVPIFS